MELPPVTSRAARRTSPGPSRASAALGALLWTLPLALLTAAWLWLAFSAGGYLERQYMLPALAISLFSLVVYVLLSYPRRPRQLSMAVLLLFAGYAVWVALSAVWASSIDRVWEEAGRSFTYLLVLTLALTFLTQSGARRAMRYLLLVGGLVLIGVSVWQLATTPDGAGLFFLNRFAFPTTYPNNSAATYLVLFWPLLWIASDPQERTPWRGLSLAACWGLLALAILTQSRGGAWAMAATVVIAMIISPVRLRTLAFLLTPAVLVVWAFPTLNSYWRLGAAQVDPWSAPRIILVGMGVALLTGTALALLERWVQVSRRMRLVFGSLLVAGVVAGGVLGWMELSQRVGDPVAWVQDSYARFTAEEETTIPGLETGGVQDQPVTRFATVGANGRWLIWQAAWKAYREDPWRGVGAGNFTIAHDRLRDRANVKARQPHSIELRLLSETGIVGAALFGAALLTALGGMLWPRMTAGWGRLRRRSPAEAGRWGNDPRRWAWNTALCLGVLYWLVHGSVEWLWHMPGVTIPALLMLALGVATTDAAAETLWPRWHRMLARSHEVTPFLMPPMVVMMRRRLHIGPEFEPPPGSAAEVPAGSPAGTQAESSAGTQAEAPAGVQTMAPDDPESASPPRGAASSIATGGGATRGAAGGAAGAGGAGGAGEPIMAAGEESFNMVRRSHRYERKWDRQARRERRARLLQPPGGISKWFRRIAAAVSLVVFLGLAAPYLSSRLQDTALSNALADRDRAMRYATLAAWLQPADPGPPLARAAAYTKLADVAAETDGLGSPQQLRDLALAVTAHIEAIDRDPAWWAVHYQAGQATVRLLEATRAASNAPQGTTGTTGAPTDADALLALAPDDLKLLARSYFLAAQQRNPLNPEIERSLQSLEESADTQRNGDS